MKTTSLLAIWFVSIALSCIFIMGVMLYPLPNTIIEPTEQVIPPAPIVVIGSSLMRFAMPGVGSGAEGGILGDGRAHVRLAISGIREEQALRLLERLLNQDVDVIFLEANPFVFDFAHRIQKPDIYSTLFTTILKQKSQDVAAKINGLLQRGSANELMTTDDSRLTNTFQVDLNAAKQYPLYLRRSKYVEKLQELIDALKAKEVKVILVAPPRSVWSTQFIGDMAAKNLKTDFQNLAKQLDLPLFQPDTFWKNENFWDSAHMNNIGRKRFLKELKTWWNAQQ
jgi:hypothetical protein